MNSCIYETDIMHCRLKPKRHQFMHRFFMFYLDLDEIDQLANDLSLFSHNRFNVYDFRDEDHILFKGSRIKENILHYLESKGVSIPNGKVMLLTNVRTLGYIFNPVSFYFCFDKNDQPVCVVTEIGNTFGELKAYFTGPSKFVGESFRDQQQKNYYISPFVDLDIILDLDLRIPNEKLFIAIDDLQNNEKLIVTTMSGRRKPLTNKTLLHYSLACPLVTLKVIFLIHLHAGILHFFKKVPHHRKEDNPELQKEVFRAWSKN